MQVRVEVRSMTSDQLASFRQAVTASMGVSDDRGYSAWAGIHGLPLPISCQHDNSLFLPVALTPRRKDRAVTAELFRFDDMSLRTYLAGTDRGLATVT